MNSRQLEYFVRIAELGSFRRGSESLHIAQPALTRQIKNLEAELGVELFDRRSGGVALTKAGSLLLERARFILRQTEQAKADVVAEGTVPSGSVTFGAPPSISEILFGPLSEAYLARYPDVRLRFYEGVGHLHTWLLNDEIDLAILPNSRLVDTRSFGLRTFVGEPIYLVGTAGDLKPNSMVTIHDILSLPLVLTPPPSTVRDHLDDAVRGLGTRVKVVAETESMQVQKKLVCAGLGYALLPHSAVHFDSDAGLLSLSVVEGWTLGRVLAWRNDRPLSLAVKRMVELTEQIMESLRVAGAFGPPAA